MAGCLVICATPIGNLDDATSRLCLALKSADVVYAEDTRRSRKLLEHLGVSKPLRSYFTGNEQVRSVELGERLQAGDTVALVTDAGTPGVADPGLSAVRSAVEAGAAVTVIPGPSAVTAALAVAGLPAHRFVFEGFLPRKAGAIGRRLDSLSRETRTLVLFSAPKRVVADLAVLSEALGPARPVVVCRELTKVHEEVFRGSLSMAVAHWSSAVEPRGEFTFVIAGAEDTVVEMDDVLVEVKALVQAGQPLSAAVRRVARASGVSRRDLYERAVRSRDGA